MSRKERIEPFILVILGAKGDLTRRKLIPALYHLARQGYLRNDCFILGAGRGQDFNDQTYREWVHQALADAGQTWEGLPEWCEQHILFQSLGEGNRSGYQSLQTRLESLEKDHQLPGNRLFYLAMPPSAFPDSITLLGESGLNKSPGWTRLIVEKPFGKDLESAVALNQLVHQHFDESQIYRIDHYLGKETVQNLLVFRFANSIFEAIWNRKYIQSIQFIVSEELGVGKRAGYYDRSGALRDMIQNHITQLLTLIAMEVPVAFEADAIRHEKIKVLRSIMGIPPSNVAFGQYTQGNINSQEVPGYLDEPNISPTSKTETFVAMKLELDSWRWQGVPFYICTGKRLPQRLTQIIINFERAPICMFQSFGACLVHNNTLVMTLQPRKDSP